MQASFGAIGRHAQYRKSGLSRKAFCERHHLKRSTLVCWFCRLGMQKKEHGMVELNRTSTGHLTPCVVVSVGQDWRIEIRKGFDPQLLAEVACGLGGLGL